MTTFEESGFDSYLARLANPRGLGIDPGLSTGLADLDRVLGGGLRPGQLVVIAARPGMGKSVLMTQIIAHVAMRMGVPALMVSFEMSREEVEDRIVANLARVPLAWLRSADLTEAEARRICDLEGDIAATPLTISDSPDAGMEEIRAMIRRQHRAVPAGLVAVDSAELLARRHYRASSRDQEISALSADLKFLAMDAHVPVLVTAQLDRKPPGRVDQRPRFPDDLRSSEALGQDADVVILLHREDAYEPMSPRAGLIDLIVAKQRNGGIGTITAAFQGYCARIADM